MADSASLGAVLVANSSASTPRQALAQRCYSIHIATNKHAHGCLESFDVIHQHHAHLPDATAPFTFNMRFLRPEQRRPQRAKYEFFQLFRLSEYRAN